MPGKFKRVSKDGLPKSFRLRKNPETNRITHPVKTGSKLNVRSKLEEQTIAIFEKFKIDFIYEPTLLIEGRKIKPDFFLSKHNLFIEICGLRGMPYYNDRQGYKKKLYDKYDIPVVFVDVNNQRQLKLKLLAELSQRKIIKNHL